MGQLTVSELTAADWLIRLRSISLTNQLSAASRVAISCPIPFYIAPNFEKSFIDTFSLLIVDMVDIFKFFDYFYNSVVVSTD